MRVAVDYRMLDPHADYMGRGVGRFTQMQLRQVLAVDRDNEYLLVCGERADLSLVPPDIRESPNVRMARTSAADAPDPTAPNDPTSVLRHSAQLQDWVYRRKVDLFHATAPFGLTMPVFPHFDACPMVATLYDLIPLVFPVHYLTDIGARETYMRALGYLAGARKILAISEATRMDAQSYLGFPREQIDVVLPYAEPHFAPLRDDERMHRLALLHSRIRLPERYILTVSGLHHCKNLPLLYRAYRLLPVSLRRRLPIVVVSNLAETAVAHARRVAARFDVADRVTFTGAVSDAELAALYNDAAVVVHPSRYEGFGLPVVEAMQCGAAVITTTAPALSEVAGDGAWLVDPDDAPALALAVEALCEGPSREAMRTRAIDRARTFDPEALGRGTLASYRHAVASPTPK